MRNLVVLVEERSAQVLLQGLIPRLVPAAKVTYLVFEGKQDLEKNVVRKLRAWQDDNAAFLVLRDKDSGACEVAKERLAQACRTSGKERWKVRIACHELEAWLLGDLAAVGAGLELAGIAEHQNKVRYREPDSTPHPSKELSALTKEKYQKVGGCRAIGPHLALEGNRSVSFGHFVAAVRALVFV